MHLKKTDVILVKYLIKEVDSKKLLLGDRIQKSNIILNDDNELSKMIYSVLKDKKIGYSGKFLFQKKVDKEPIIEKIKIKDFPETAYFDIDEIIIFGVEKKRIGRVLKMTEEEITVDFENPLRKKEISLEIKFLDIIKEKDNV